MHVGMEEPVAEHLREEDLDAAARQLRQIHALRPQAVHLADRRAGHALHHHDLGSSNSPSTPRAPAAAARSAKLRRSWLALAASRIRSSSSSRCFSNSATTSRGFSRLPSRHSHCDQARGAVQQRDVVADDACDPRPQNLDRGFRSVRAAGPDAPARPRRWRRASARTARRPRSMRRWYTALQRLPHKLASRTAAPGPAASPARRRYRPAAGRGAWTAPGRTSRRSGPAFPARGAAAPRAAPAAAARTTAALIRARSPRTRSCPSRNSSSPKRSETRRIRSSRSRRMRARLNPDARRREARDALLEPLDGVAQQVDLTAPSLAHAPTRCASSGFSSVRYSAKVCGEVVRRLSLPVAAGRGPSRPCGGPRCRRRRGSDPPRRPSAARAARPRAPRQRPGRRSPAIWLRARSSPAASTNTADTGMRTTTSGPASSPAGRSCPPTSTRTISLAGNTSSSAVRPANGSRRSRNQGLPAQQVIQACPRQLRREQRGWIGEGGRGRSRLAGQADGLKAVAAMQRHHAGGQVPDTRRAPVRRPPSSA